MATRYSNRVLAEVIGDLALGVLILTPIVAFAMYMIVNWGF
jgi:hypothetical protein